MSKRYKKPRVRPASSGALREWLDTRLLLAVVAVMAVVVFFPLTKYFFAQDDFVLMLRASSEPAAMLGEFFGGDPGQFRPLTKIGYFAPAYALFGLEPRPYHLVSLFLHVVNVVLFFVLVRRIGGGRVGAIVGAELFALSMAFFHVLAWISCIQQIIALSLLLVAMIAGVDLLRTGSRSALWLSLAAYVGSLLSLEQTYGVPILLVLIAVFGLGVQKRPFRAAVGRLWPHLAVLAVYVLFMGVWKKPPIDGTYAVHFGKNLAVNFVTYLGWTYEFWVVLPVVMLRHSIHLAPTHVVFAALVVYHLVRRRFAWVVFALAFFVLGVLPAIVLSLHTFYLHTYVPAFGLLLLIALLVDDVFALPWMRAPVVGMLGMAAILGGCFALSLAAARANERSVIREVPRLKSSFVLRRELIAKQALGDLKAKSDGRPEVKQVYMVYGRQENVENAVWNVRNFQEAIGKGAAIKLLYGKPKLDVRFKVVGDTIQAFNHQLSDLFVYGDFGNIFTREEASAVIGTDTTSVGE